MKPGIRAISAFKLIISFTLLWSSLSNAQKIQINAKDIALVQGYPAIGKWMIDKNGEVADWLGLKIKKGQKLLQLIEPINIIIKVSARNPFEAKEKLWQAIRRAGFSEYRHHSSGYQALIEGQNEAQFSITPETAFADRFYLEVNDHGRFFGPLFWQGRYYFTASFSKERPNFINKLLDHKSVFHTYISFNQARDKFVQNMLGAGASESMAIYLENAILDDSTYTTGDHDGMAVVLEL